MKTQQNNKMTKKELVKLLVALCKDENGVVNLSGLDFKQEDVQVVDISGMQVNGDLYQGCQEVKGKLWQACQKVEGGLYQHLQEVGRDLHQSHQMVDGNLHQARQRVRGYLDQREQNVEGNLYED